MSFSVILMYQSLSRRRSNAGKATRGSDVLRARMRRDGDAGCMFLMLFFSFLILCQGAKRTQGTTRGSVSTLPDTTSSQRSFQALVLVDLRPRWVLMRCSYFLNLYLCVFKCVYRTADLVSWKHLVPFSARLASLWSSCFVLESALSTIMPSESHTIICCHGGGTGSASNLSRYYWYQKPF